VISNTVESIALSFFLVFLCCIDSCLFDEEITHPEKFYRMCVAYEFQQWGVLGPSGAIVPWRKIPQEIHDILDYSVGSNESNVKWILIEI